MADHYFSPPDESTDPPTADPVAHMIASGNCRGRTEPHANYGHALPQCRQRIGQSVRVADLLVVTGPSCVGKSTVGRLVAADLEQSAHVRLDSFLSSVVAGRVDPWRPDATHQNRIVGGAAVASTMQFIAGGYSVVFDGTIFPDAIDELAEACQHREIPFHYVVLRCDLTTCIDRTVARDGERPSGVSRGTPRQILHARST